MHRLTKLGVETNQGAMAQKFVNSFSILSIMNTLFYTHTAQKKATG